MTEPQVEVVGAILAGPKNQDKRFTSRLKRAWPPAAVLLAVIVLWELAVRFFDIPRYILPAPSSIIATLVSKWSSSLASATRPAM